MSAVALAEDVVPLAVIQRLQEFMLDKKTGNIRLNIKDGRILGAHVEEILKIDR